MHSWIDVNMTHYCLVMVVQMDEIQIGPLMVKSLMGRHFAVNSKWSPYGEIPYGKTLCGCIILEVWLENPCLVMEY
jgi:hypothetical protein